MSEQTVRLALPLVDAGQAQKEVTHNEALAALDLLVQAGVVDVGVDGPPESPAPGQAWVVGSAPSGAWAGHANAIAGWTAGGWRFLTPCEGTEVWCVASERAARFRDGAWELGSLRGSALLIDGTPVVGARAAAIGNPTGGATVDAQARAAVGSILAALRGHGLIAP
jgi:hypothetical protein